MSRNRDLFAQDRLALRDVVQVWVLSLLVNAVVLGLILLAAPGVQGLREWAGWLALITLCIVGADLLLLAIIIVKKLIQNAL